MSDDGRLELEFVDVYGARLNEPVDILLRHRVLRDERRAARVDASRPVAVTNLRREPQGLYSLQVNAPSYQTVARFVTVPASGTAREVVTLPIRAERARGIFPSYDRLDDRVRGVLERSHEVRGLEGLTGPPLYAALPDDARAGLLNIAKKSLATEFRDGADLLPHVTLLHIIGDRLFAQVPPGLLEQMPGLVDGELFRPVNGSLHTPPAGFVAAGSYKTFDAFGNLQITFFRKGSECRADVDIDDAAGLGHVFQVLRNHLTGNPTHPFNIHQILLAHQHLDSGFRLQPSA